MLQLLSGDLGWWTGRWVVMKMRATARLRRKRIGMSRMRSWYPRQVWPLNPCVLFPFCTKSLICLEGKSMSPLSGRYSTLSSNSLTFVLDPWRAFLSWMPFWGPPLASYVASTDKQGHSQLCRTRLRGPRTPSETTDCNQTLIVLLLKTHIF